MSGMHTSIQYIVYSILWRHLFSPCLVLSVAKIMFKQCFMGICCLPDMKMEKIYRLKMHIIYVEAEEEENVFTEHILF